MEDLAYRKLECLLNLNMLPLENNVCHIVLCI